PPACQEFSLSDPTAKREFIRMPDKVQLQLSVGFPVDFLPVSLNAPSAYTTHLAEMSVSPCSESTPNPADRGAAVKLTYSFIHQLDSGDVEAPSVTVFEGRQLPQTIDVTTGTYKELRIGDLHGIYWPGAPD